jgi:CRP-like cAMP-binding protein
MISPERLRFYPFFGNLPHKNLVQLADMAEEMIVSPGQVIFREGDEIDHIYLIESGAVGLSIAIPARNKEHSLSDQLTGQLETEEVIISALDRGDVFGWSGLIPPHTSTATARALTESHLLAFDCHLLREAFREDCRFGYIMLLKIGQVIRERFEDLHMELLADKVAALPEPAAN